MRRSLAMTFFLLALFTVSALTAAGTGIKLETAGLNEYTAAGIDLELGLPGIPARPMTELLGWWAMNDDQITHLQAGLGARFYLQKASSGPFIEGKLRYIWPLDDAFEASTAILLGVGYRLKPLIGGIDIYFTTTTAEHEIIPRYMLGARLGF